MKAAPVALSDSMKEEAKKKKERSEALLTDMHFVLFVYYDGGKKKTYARILVLLHLL